MAIRERRGSVTGWSGSHSCLSRVSALLRFSPNSSELLSMASRLLHCIRFMHFNVGLWSCLGCASFEPFLVRFAVVFVFFRRFLSFFPSCVWRSSKLSLCLCLSLCSSWACFFLLPLDVVECFSLFLDRGFWSVLGSSLCELLSASLLKRVDFFELMEDRERDQSFWSRGSWERKSHSEGERERESKKETTFLSWSSLNSDLHWASFLLTVSLWERERGSGGEPKWEDAREKMKQVLYEEEEEESKMVEGRGETTATTTATTDDEEHCFQRWNPSSWWRKRRRRSYNNNKLITKFSHCRKAWCDGAMLWKGNTTWRRHLQAREREGGDLIKIFKAQQ